MNKYDSAKLCILEMLTDLKESVREAETTDGLTDLAIMAIIDDIDYMLFQHSDKGTEATIYAYMEKWSSPILVRELCIHNHAKLQILCDWKALGQYLLFCIEKGYY